MPGKLLTTLFCAIALAGLTLPAGAAAADSVGAIYGDYTKDGDVNGCDYSAGQINGAIGSIPTDVAQYDPGFKNALNKALADSCGKGADGSRTSNPGGAPQGYGPDGSPGPRASAASSPRMRSSQPRRTSPPPT